MSQIRANETLGSKQTSPDIPENRIPELDGIRGIAVIMVLIWHYINCQYASSISPLARYIVATTNLFWSGVDLFFVLSGFLIGGILYDNIDKKGALFVFYLRRTLRIFPLYFVVVICGIVAARVAGIGNESWLFHGDIPSWSYFVFVQNVYMGIQGDFGGNFLSATWSLAVEEQFYVCLPLLFLLFGRRNIVFVVGVLIIMAIIIRHFAPGFHATVNTPFRMDSLLTGVMVAIALRSKYMVSILRSQTRLLWTCFNLLGLVMITMTVLKLGRASFEPLAIAVFYSLLLALAVLNRSSTTTKPLRSRSFVWFGTYSYGIYLLHQPVAGFTHQLFRGSYPVFNSIDGVVCTLISLAVTLLLAVASYHLFESYFLRIGKSFSYSPPGKLQRPLESSASF